MTTKEKKCYYIEVDNDGLVTTERAFAELERRGGEIATPIPKTRYLFLGGNGCIGGCDYISSLTGFTELFYDVANDYFFEAIGIMHTTNKVEYVNEDGSPTPGDIFMRNVWNVEKDAVRGDIVCDRHGQPFIFSGKFFNGYVCGKCGLDTLGRLYVNEKKSGAWARITEVRPANAEKKKALLAEMKRKNVSWNKKTKSLDGLGWLPKDGETYYYISFTPERCRFFVEFNEWNEEQDEGRFFLAVAKGLVFKSSDEAKTTADKWNEMLDAELEKERENNTR